MTFLRRAAVFMADQNAKPQDLPGDSPDDPDADELLDEPSDKGAFVAQTSSCLSVRALPARVALTAPPSTRLWSLLCAPQMTTRTRRTWASIPWQRPGPLVSLRGAFSLFSV